MKRNFILSLGFLITLASCLASPEEYYRNQGLDKMKKHDFEGAISEFNKALDNLEKYSTGSNLYYNKGLANENLKQYKKAIEDYKKAVELDSNYAEAYLQLAMMEIKFNNESIGCEYLNKAKKIYNIDTYAAYHMQEKGVTADKFDSLLTKYCK